MRKQGDMKDMWAMGSRVGLSRLLPRSRQKASFSLYHIINKTITVGFRTHLMQSGSMPVLPVYSLIKYGHKLQIIYSSFSLFKKWKKKSVELIYNIALNWGLKCCFCYFTTLPFSHSIDLFQCNHLCSVEFMTIFLKIVFSRNENFSHSHPLCSVSQISHCWTQ